MSTQTLQTTTRPTSTRAKSTATATGTHDPCGGGRAGPYLDCKSGYTCIKDPYTPGCGPACDGVGICVADRCGGFAGFSCPDARMVCHDDVADDCDPMNGGADCMGFCVWPH
jgi:hypothetical protein